MRRGVKSIETKHYEERDRLFQGLSGLSRRSFMRLAGLSAGIVAAKGLLPPHSFQLIDVAEAQPGGTSKPKFSFAYISDTHLYEQKLNDRFVRAITRAIDDVNGL